MAEKDKEKKIGDALWKVALGYQVAEVVEEYAEVDGALKLTKRKKTKKDVPPDLKAVQLLLSTGTGGAYVSLTDEELEAERERLLLALAEEEKSNTTVKTTVKKTSTRTATKRKSVRKSSVKKK